MRQLVLVGLLAPALASCGDDDCCAVPRDAAVDQAPDAPPTPYVEVALFPQTTNRDLDLLFVIDDSPSMLDKQTNLKNSFSQFINVLNTSPGGLPNIHIGVITTDVGSKGQDDAQAGPGIGSGPGSCASTGKNGVLQTNSSTLVSGMFISDIVNPDSTRTRNYTGTLEAAFSAIASVGASGCGFEQPLHSLYLALNNNAANVGFLRPNARLGIVVLADEDDCSMSHSTLMGNDTNTLGPLQSFRCTRFGVTCDGGGINAEQMNQLGIKTGCHSNETSAYTADVGRYATFVNGLKSDSRDVVVTVIAGAQTPFEVVDRVPPGGGAEIRALEFSCTYQGAVGAEVAVPPTRLVDFTTRVRRGNVDSVCSGELTTQMTSLGQRMKSLVGDSCLQAEIAFPHQCRVFDSNAGVETELVECTDTSGLPCYTLVADGVTCPAGTQHYKADVMRANAPPPTTWTSVRCVL